MSSDTTNEATSARRLFVIGAGPVGRNLAALAASVGFDVTVLDDRASLLVAEAFPAGVHLQPGSLEELLPALETTADDFVAIVSQVWRQDELALRLLVNRPLTYLGLIGCQRKLGVLFPALEQSGVSPEAIAAIRAPIGLDIGSKTPAEIAISIAAELVAVRAGRR